MIGLILTWLLIGVQIVYLASALITLWFYTLPVNLVDRSAELPPKLPKIVLFYPVLRELEQTMRTTFTGMRRAQYPQELLRVISIPNDNDPETIASLKRLQLEFPFLEVLPVPATTDPTWDAVWQAWETNPKAYWWHQDKRKGDKALPPKKTRQLIWAMYQVAPGNEDALLSYIDADSVVPEDFWKTAAIGMESYDVVQNTNITGNLLSSWPASFYAMDHIAWDSSLYKHMSADGQHPFYVLGKGLFFRFSDLLKVGGFHPWLTIEDPEIGMRMWTNGAKLGVVESPLIEEVPATWSQGVTQRKRWVAGFFQTLSAPLTRMGMTRAQRFRARLNFVPCLSLAFNPIGFSVGIWALVASSQGEVQFSIGTTALSILTMSLALTLMVWGMVQAGRMSRPVLPQRRDRVRYVLRVNLVFILVYWLWWAIPLAKGFTMFLQDGGLVWERTEKRDANSALVRREVVTD
ncbi:glycosyltransferase family 2 protein [Cryobacterium glaciale]|uniref:Glycosyltransferase family 2 protein n=1 Tax=Cryobacterium glaciale TaxID=1259145 RepID=A0A4R8V4E9_9MICO|nr:glycosyltransferase family 2 protein [Cryobacterium glaciale]TFB76411.1 glycosyltransferase family 2 protein [Cryobacterium glaciale]